MSLFYGGMPKQYPLIKVYLPLTLVGLLRTVCYSQHGLIGHLLLTLFFCHANVESDDGSDIDKLMVHSWSKENDTQIDDLDEHSDHDIDMSENEQWSEESDSDVDEML